MATSKEKVKEKEDMIEKLHLDVAMRGAVSISMIKYLFALN